MNQKNKEDLQEISNNSKYSFYLGATTIGLFFAIFGLTYLKMTNNINGSLHSALTLILAIVIFTIGLSGIQYALKSIKQKEQNTAHKVIGIITNLIVLIAFLSFVYVFITDVYGAATH